MTTHLSADPHSEPPTSNGDLASAEPITVTILDAATIFEGPETVYRYDLPGTVWPKTQSNKGEKAQLRNAVAFSGETLTISPALRRGALLCLRLLRHKPMS